MADDLKTITRVIEYHGSVDWLEQTLSASRIPLQGVKQFNNGFYIKSGVINWQTETVEPVEQQIVEQPSDVKTVPFRKPGE